MIRKIVKYILALLLSVFLVGATYMAVTFTPVLAGTAAKTMCSCLYVLGRTQQSVVEKELQVVPLLDKAKFEIVDSTSVTATILWEKRTAIFRKGLGCTLLAEQSEAQVRSQNPALPNSPTVNPNSIPWPMGDQITDSIVPGVNYDGIRGAIDEAFAETNPEKPKHTLAVVVLYDGKIVGEQYAPGYNYQTPLMGWSMTKSLTNALVGVLVKEGKLDLNAPAPVAEWQADERKDITLNNLMQASSGLEWNESYFTPGHFHNMFMHSDDKGGYAAARKLKYPIGERFEYSSGTSNLLSKIVRQAIGDGAYPKYAYDNFFYRIGMLHTLVEQDASGTFVGSSYGYASARDWARFGLLYLNDGVWNGERILPEGWVAYSATPAPAALQGEYGAQFWLNAGETGNPQNCYHPGVPNDEFGAEGFEQQNVFIIPSKKLVLVRLGISHHGFDMEGLTQKVIEALP